MYSAILIQALLDLQNVKETSELSNKESQNLEGARLNELCDTFYKKYVMNPEVSWPSPQHKQLRDYLLDTVKHNSRGAAAFAEKMGLVEDSDKYLTTSRYSMKS